MSQDFVRNPDELGAGYPIIGLGSAVFAHADPVTIDANGFLIVATAGVKILGWYTGQGETMATTNATVAKVCPQYVYADGVEMEITGDQDCTQTDIGAYADISGTTGAIAVNLAAGASGSLLVLGFDPKKESANAQVIVIVAEPQKSAAAQA